MYCLKCGRETDSSHVFCDTCLEVMARYPVKPDAAVQLPHRSLAPERPSVPKKRPPSTEELLAQARRQNRKLQRLVILLCIAMTLTAGLFLLRHFKAPIIENIGRNYTIFTD